VALSGGMHAVHAEATGPKFGRSDGPVVLPTSVLHIGAKDHTIAFGAKLAVANDGGYGVVVMIAAVASANLVVGSDLMIHLNVELPSRSGLEGHGAPVDIGVGRPGNVGVRIQIQNRLADRVDLVRRDLVVYRYSVDYIGELVPRTRIGSIVVTSARVVDAGVCGIRIRRIWQVGRALGEVTGTLQVGGDDSLQVYRILLAHLFEIDKEECLVLLQRTAQREAILIPHVVGLFAGVEVVA